MAVFQVVDEFANYLAASGGAAGLDINGDSYLAVLSNVAPTKAGTQILTDITQIAGTGGYAASALSGITWAETGAGTGIWQFSSNAFSWTASGADFAITGGSEVQPSGGYLEAYDDQRRRHRSELRQLEEAKESESSIQSELDAQIAALLHEQEAKDLERADLARLQALADEYKGRQRDVPERVNAALLAAQERRTLGSLLALRRETDRTMEEEELVLLLLLLNE